MHWTTDNASNNRTLLKLLYETVTEKNLNISLDHVDAHIWCFPHIVNLVTQAMLWALDKGVDSGSTDYDDLPALRNSNDDEEDMEGERADINEEDDIMIVNITTGIVSKVHQLVRTIHVSGQCQDTLDHVIKIGNDAGLWTDFAKEVVQIKPRCLILDVRTQWDSTYQMLVHISELRQVML